MKKEEVLDILKSAILLERKGKAFYENVASQTTSPTIKEIFESMAGEEDTHIQYLSEHYKALMETGKFIPREGDMSAHDFSSEVITKKIRTEITAASFEASAISAARLMEERAVEFYSSKADEADDPEAAKTLNWLANWEKTHLKVLDDIDKDLQQSVWFDNNFWPY